MRAHAVVTALLFSGVTVDAVSVFGYLKNLVRSWGGSSTNKNQKLNAFNVIKTPKTKKSHYSADDAPILLEKIKEEMRKRNEDLLYYMRKSLEWHPIKKNYCLSNDDLKILNNQFDLLEKTVLRTHDDLKITNKASFERVIGKLMRAKRKKERELKKFRYIKPVTVAFFWKDQQKAENRDIPKGIKSNDVADLFESLFEWHPDFAEYSNEFKNDERIQWASYRKTYIENINKYAKMSWEQLHEVLYQAKQDVFVRATTRSSPNSNPQQLRRYRDNSDGTRKRMRKRKNHSYDHCLSADIGKSCDQQKESSVRDKN